MVGKSFFVCVSCVLGALLLHANMAAAGSSYIRWGRSTCPDGARALYKGYISGSHYTHAGSGSNLLCAHEEPMWSPNNVPGMQPYSARLYGTEFQLNTGYTINKPLLSDNAQGANLDNRDPVCVVCYVPNSSTNIMITGRLDCGKGNEDMRLEYKGMLMGEYHGFSANEYICVDEAPEARLGSESDIDGALLYAVQATCGALPCPAYVEGNEVTCAVCSI